MTGAAKSGLTLAMLVLLVLVGAVWGWAALTKPLPKKEPVAICAETDVAAGAEVRRDQVVISVFNGSKRSGLAGSTMAALTERGFVEGDIGDSPVSADTTQIWSSDPSNPAVQLVQRQFKQAKVVAGDPIGDGIVVVVGAKFTSLKKKQVESVVAEADTTYCRATGSDAG